MKQQYRGFDITLSAGDHWSARIARSETGKSWSHELATPCLKAAPPASDARKIW